MIIDSEITDDKLDDMNAVYTVNRYYDVCNGIAEALNENRSIQWADEAKNTVELNIEKACETVTESIKRNPEMMMETISRIVRYDKNIDSKVYVLLKGTDAVENVDFDEIDNRVKNDIVSTTAEVGYMMPAKDTELRTPYLCQNDHITYNTIERGSEMRRPPKCIHKMEKNNGDREECKSTPNHRLTNKEMNDFGYSAKFDANTIRMTTQEMVLTNPELSDSESNVIGAEVDQPLVDEFDSRDEIEIIGKVLSVNDEEERSTKYYIHILGYERVDKKLDDVDKKQLEELQSEIDPLVDLSEKIGKDSGIEDSDGQINRARKLLLISAVKGSDILDNHNIHILLYGKSGSGKSRLARSILELTTGEFIDMRKSSEAGIIGANQQSDALGGRFIIESGAVTQASGGICVADEIDKVKRSSKQMILGEPMQNQTTTITKTADGTLPADVSVILTGNPKDDIYADGDKIDSLDLEPHIMDRIDLATRIDPYKFNSSTSDLDQRQDDIERSLMNQISDSDEGKIDKETIRKYIKYAKSHNPDPKPVFDEISSNIVKIEKELTDTSERLQSTIVNISTAIAKLSFRDKVKSEDVKRATELYKDAWESVK